MADDQGEKTEQATDAKREEFRKRGQVAMTRELSTALFFLVSAGVLYASSRFVMQNIVEIFNRTMGAELVYMVREGRFIEMLVFAGYKLGLLITPLMLAALVIGVLSQVLQTGLLQNEEALQPNLNKLNPLSGLKRIFSVRGLGELLKSIMKMVAICLIVYKILKSEINLIPYLSGYDVQQIMGYLGVIVFKLFLTAGIFMLVLAAADYFFQRWRLEKEMMMTKQEVKEEHKSREGDPIIKARIRKVQREMASRKMMADVPKGDVVVTNPTHIAVVLKYSDNLPAPQLIAKGGDHVAEKIKQIARDNNIPIIENKPLARTIFKTMKIGQVIPRELFVAVAEVLSYVYRLRRKKRNAGSRVQPEQGI
ncbi:flagellar biosynthesis protein FlhB [Pseudobdellovibrio exovorus]|uniref:Flagellar biosynthetic protein FlhB n=1 Tax=Pseudobdellovibrio exovorus JSS TaxID=1184267 RepID=M4V6J8_9BACT|nr:flagellar biosynthesis protein FlhB [Pseudobdellovibrio exovorus]AGH94833.1 flagella-associated protein [Pseudobdellovibrio exovorus JSS]